VSSGCSTRGLGQPEQDRFLAANPAQVLGELALDAAVRPRVDSVDQSDQQLDQRVGDLRGTQPAQRGQQCQPHRSRRRAQVRRIGPDRPGPPPLDQLLARVGEQSRRKAQRPHRGQLVDLAQQSLQPDLARVGLQLGEQYSTRGRCAAVLGDERLQRVYICLIEPCERAVAKPLLEHRPRRLDDSIHPSGRLDPLGAAAHQQGLA